MTVQLHHRYSIEDIYAAFGGDDQGEILCGGDFIVFPDAVVCCVMVGHPGEKSRFALPDRFEWRPRQFDFAPKEQWRWLPRAVRDIWDPADRSRKLKTHHVFVRAPADSDYFYARPAHLGSYGGGGSEGVAAHFTLETALPREAWLAFGGSLLPWQPFASLPVSEGRRKDIRFHWNTLDLLHIMPPQSKTIASLLDRIKRDEGLNIPASVREWYSLMGCMDVIMRELSRIHTPASIVEDHSELMAQYALTTPYRQMMPVMFENQGVWHLTVALDDRDDDPPVYLGYQGSDTFDWQLHAHHFSEFVYAWAWEYVASQRDYIVDVSHVLTEEDMAAIRAHFAPRATTFGGVGFLQSERYERYTGGEQRISVVIQPGGSRCVWFSAETAGALEALIRRPWSFADRIGEELGFDIEMQKMVLSGLPPVLRDMGNR